MKRLIILVIFLAVVGLGSYLFYKEGTLPVNRETKTSKIFVIRKGEGLSEVAKNLAGEGLIRNKIVFYLVVKRLGIDKNIQAGDFRLSQSMDVYEVARTLTHGTLDVWVTIIEGLRKEEVAQIISQNLGIPEVEFLKYAKEGYLFPDTYLFPRQATAGAVIDILSSNFEKKYDTTLRSQARLNGLTDKEVLILASIVEREARSDSDRKQVASILLKRLRADWPLQTDATIQYAVGYDETDKSWWKKNLSEDDLKIDSPYNTYKHIGLPPTPVTNPGLSSIQAVVRANADIPYWFYLSDRKGIMHYAVTHEEHERNIGKYLQ